MPGNHKCIGVARTGSELGLELGGQTQHECSWPVQWSRVKPFQMSVCLSVSYHSL